MGERAVTSTQTTEHVHYDASANDDYHTDHDSAAYEPALARESHACHGTSVATDIAMTGVADGHLFEFAQCKAAHSSRCSTRRAFQRCSQSLGSDLCIGETDTVDACSRRTPSACPWSYLVNEDTVSCPSAPRVFRAGNGHGSMPFEIGSLLFTDPSEYLRLQFTVHPWSRMFPVSVSRPFDWSRDSDVGAGHRRSIRNSHKNVAPSEIVGKIAWLGRNGSATRSKENLAPLVDPAHGSIASKLFHGKFMSSESQAIVDITCNGTDSISVLHVSANMDHLYISTTLRSLAGFVPLRQYHHLSLPRNCNSEVSDHRCIIARFYFPATYDGHQHPVDRGDGSSISFLYSCCPLAVTDSLSTCEDSQDRVQQRTLAHGSPRKSLVVQ
nr:hypothetical protein CFP56_12118 [Quercus suber]